LYTNMTCVISPRTWPGSPNCWQRTDRDQFAERRKKVEAERRKLTVKNDQHFLCGFVNDVWIQHTNNSLLSVAYERSGPDNGRPVFLLHGWPDDIRTWDNIIPALHAAGWQTIVPYLRGFGDTSFLSTATTRSGEIVAFAQDLLELADALGIHKSAVIGHDWSARTAYIASCFAPERICHCVALSWPGEEMSC